MTARAYSNRFEIKYVVESRRLAKVKAALVDFLEPDPNRLGNQGYFVHSIYFDTPDFRMYCEKREGELIRIKARIRSYRSAPDGVPQGIFLELKGRYDRIVAKRRTPIDEALARSILASPVPDLNGVAVVPSALGEFTYLCHRHRLAPSVTVLYHRTPYHGSFYPDMRITFDEVIQCSLANRLDAPSADFRSALSADHAIIELKYNEKVPASLLRLIHSLGLQQRTISKYAISLEACYRHVYRGRLPV